MTREASGHFPFIRPQKLVWIGFTVYKYQVDKRRVYEELGSTLASTMLKKTL